MKEIPKVGFICTGENALELSGAICCAGRLMRFFSENGYMTGGCYSCISPSKQIPLLRERIGHMCMCNDVVVTVGCDGFREGDVIPDIVLSLGTKELPFFSCKLSSDEYTDYKSGKTYKCFPSRGVACVRSKALVLCVSSDLMPTLGKLSSIMPSIGFVITNTSKKVPANPCDEDDWMQDFGLERSFHD